MNNMEKINRTDRVKNEKVFRRVKEEGNVLRTVKRKGNRTAVAQWLRRCATNRKVAGSIPDGVTGIFH